VWRSDIVRLVHVQNVVLMDASSMEELCRLIISVDGEEGERDDDSKRDLLADASGRVSASVSDARVRFPYNR